MFFPSHGNKSYFLRPFIYGAFVFGKFLCPSFKANTRRFLHPKKHNFISFPTVSITIFSSGSIQQQFSFFWCHPILEISRIHEKCANCVLLHSKTLPNFLSNSSFNPFLWSEFRKCIINKWSEEVRLIINLSEKWKYICVKAVLYWYLSGTISLRIAVTD